MSSNQSGSGLGVPKSLCSYFMSTPTKVKERVLTEAYSVRFMNYTIKPQKCESGVGLG